MPAENGKIQYALITESPGLKATQEQLERLYQRYRFAQKFAGGKDVLEVACGSGIGLRYLAERARSVLGIDVDQKNVAIARDICAGSAGIRVDLMDAHQLRLADGGIDVLLLFEALYYLSDPIRCMAEAHRVLRPGGALVICAVNKDWADFHPSPFAHKYFSVPELYDLIRHSFDSVAMYGGFPVEKKSMKDRAVSLIKRAALKCDLIPGSLSARAYLKRIFIGKLVPLPDAIRDGMAPYRDPVEISSGQICKDFKIVYAVAYKK